MVLLLLYVKQVKVHSIFKWGMLKILILCMYYLLITVVSCTVGTIHILKENLEFVFNSIMISSLFLLF